MATVNGDLYDSIVTDNERTNVLERGARVRMFTDKFTTPGTAVAGAPGTGDRFLVGWLPAKSRVIGVVLVNTDATIASTATLQFGDEDTTFTDGGSAATDSFGGFFLGASALVQRCPVGTFGSHLNSNLFGNNQNFPTAKIKDEAGPLHIHLATAATIANWNDKDIEITVFYVSD